MIVDIEGEALQLLKTLHEQSHQGQCLELKASTEGVLDEALGAMCHGGASVVLDLEDISAATVDLIAEIARRLKALPKAVAARLILCTRCADW
jgi:hypothetical protein